MRVRLPRVLLIAGAAFAVLAIAALWNEWRKPTYLPPPGDEINILLELAGVFPDNYRIMWREHAALRSTDPEARAEPAILGDALFMHRLTTGADGDVYIEAEYRYYDHDRDPVEGPPFTCSCGAFDRTQTRCIGQTTHGNYEFSLTARYTAEVCTDPVSPKRQEEFARTMQVADRLIGLYLKPLRNKPDWM